MVPVLGLCPLKGLVNNHSKLGGYSMVPVLGILPSYLFWILVLDIFLFCYKLIFTHTGHLNAGITKQLIFTHTGHLNTGPAL